MLFNIFPNFPLLLSIFLILVSFSTKASIADFIQGRGQPEEDDILDFFCQAPLFRATFGECEESREATVRFLLYTRNDPLNPYTLQTNDINNLRMSPFIFGAPVKILIHGYTGSANRHPYPAVTREAYLTLGGDLTVNVISVDWKDSASGGIASVTRPYSVSVGCTFGVARKTADLIKFLRRHDYVRLDRLHIVGHSLGAHLAALVGQEFNGNISRVTGLDPARPCYRRGDNGYSYRIGPDVARFVDIIHTDGEVGRGLGNGLNEQLGHIDFYPNGGVRRQPGCSQQILSPSPDGGCSHRRAPQLFAESIQNPLAFIGRRCESWVKFQSGICNLEEEGVMGEYAQPSKTTSRLSYSGSNFYFFTTSQTPFGLGSSGALASPNNNNNYRSNRR